MKKLTLIGVIAILFSCFILFPVCAVAIPTLGVAPGEPDQTTANLSYDGFPIGLDGGQITIWYGSNSGEPTFGIDYSIWLLTTSANGDDFSFQSGGYTLPFGSADLSVASYKDPVFGVNLTDNAVHNFAFTGEWTEFQPPDETFYSYEFGTGSKEFWYLTGELVVGTPGLVVGDWMYAVLDLEGNSVKAFSPPTTSTMATPEPASMLLLGSGLLGLVGLGRKKFFKK